MTGHDGLENYNMLWLNQSLADELQIQRSDFIEGFIGRNHRGEIVLKCNFWKEDYVGDGMITGIRDEIPRLEGMELLIHKDYFEKLKEYYNTKPIYCSYLSNDTK